MLVENQVGIGLTSYVLAYSQLRQHVNKVVMRSCKYGSMPLWCGPGNVHVFLLGGQSYRSKWATAQTPTAPAVSYVRIKTSIFCALNFTNIACGKWRPVTN